MSVKLTDVGGEEPILRQFLEVGHDNDGNNIGGSGDIAPGDPGDVLFTDPAPSPTFAEIVADNPAIYVTGWTGTHDYAADIGTADGVQFLKPTGTTNVFAAEVQAGSATGGSEPDWDGDAPNVGDSVADGDLTWFNVGPLAGFPDPVTWAANTAYTLPVFVWPTEPNGHLYTIFPGYPSGIGPMTSDSWEPGWPTEDHFYVADGDGYWFDLGTTDSTVVAWKSRASAAGFGQTWSLTRATAVGAEAIVVDGSAGLLQNGHILAVGANTGNCELRMVAEVNGNAVTLNTALAFAHSADDLVFWSPAGEFHPALWGADGATSGFDSWAPLQKALYQASKLLNVSSLAGYGPIINGGHNTYEISQPLTFSKTTFRDARVWVASPLWTGPADTTNAALMTSSQNHYPITATASDNTIRSTTTQSFPGPGETIVFNNMYGETLPGSIVGGRVYFIKTRAGDGLSATISATSGGSEFDITSDGAGWAAGQIADLTKIWWDNIVLNVAVADLNGMLVGMQQPGEIERLRVNMTAACSRTTYGLVINKTQICRIYDPEFVVNGADNVVALGICVPGFAATSVSGVHVQDANFAGSGASGQTHIVIGGGSSTCDSIVLGGETWLESPGDAGIRLDAGRAVSLGNLFCSGSPTNGVLYENATGLSWDVGQIFQASANKILLKTAQGTLFKTFGSSDSEESDVAFVLGGARRIGDSVSPELILKDRQYTAISSSITLPYLTEVANVSASGGSCTITLRTAVGVSGMTHTIRKSDSSANTVTVDPAGSETVNGASTLVLSAQYEFVTVRSDGANWVIVTSGFDTDGTLASNSDLKTPSQKAVKTYVDTKVSTHEADTTSVHGITDTAELALKSYVQAHIPYANWMPASGKIETLPRWALPSGATALTSGTLYLMALPFPLFAGVIYTSITFISNGAATNPTNWWFTLVNKADLKTLRSTADQTSTAWGANTLMTVNLSSTYTPSVDTDVYLGVMMAAATPISMRTFSATGGLGSSFLPVLSATSSTGLTTPLSDGTAVASLNGIQTPFWGCVS